jgi:replicative DNA helicase
MKGVTYYLESLIDDFNSNCVGDRMATGFPSLDSLIGGLNRSELVTIAGRPKMGKTCILSSILLHLLINEKRKILFFSLEKPGKDLITHFISYLTGLEVNEILLGNLSSHHCALMRSAFELVSMVELKIDDTAAVTHQFIEDRIEKLRHADFSPDLVVLDYVQLMTVEAGEEYTRAAQLSEITRHLKKIARNNNVCLIIASQLNRDCEYRPNKRPQLVDLLDSGSIENDSDLVLFLYREGVYREEASDKGLIEINVSKNRNGRTGHIKVEYPFKWSDY